MRSQRSRKQQFYRGENSQQAENNQTKTKNMGHCERGHQEARRSHQKTLKYHRWTSIRLFLLGWESNSCLNIIKNVNIQSNLILFCQTEFQSHDFHVQRSNTRGSASRVPGASIMLAVMEVSLETCQVAGKEAHLLLKKTKPAALFRGSVPIQQMSNMISLENISKGQ